MRPGGNGGDEVRGRGPRRCCRPTRHGPCPSVPGSPQLPRGALNAPRRATEAVDSRSRRSGLLSLSPAAIEHESHHSFDAMLSTPAQRGSVRSPNLGPVSGVDAVELEVRELVRRRGIDPSQDRAAVRRLVDEVVADDDEQSLSSTLATLPDPKVAARGRVRRRCRLRPTARHLDDSSVEETSGSSSDCALGESRAHVAARTLSSEARSMSALPADEQNGRLWPSLTCQAGRQAATAAREHTGGGCDQGGGRPSNTAVFWMAERRLQVAEKRTLEDIDGDWALGGVVSAATDREPSDRGPTSWRSLETVGAHV